MADYDTMLCKIAEGIGARVAYATSPDMEHLITVTPQELRQLMNMRPLPLDARGKPTARIKGYWHDSGFLSAVKHNGEWQPLVLEV